MPATELEVACIQMAHQPELGMNLAAARKLATEAVSDGAELVLLPEYWFVERERRLNPDTAHHYAEVPGFLEDLSRDLDVVIAGNGPQVDGDSVRNACYLVDRGETVGVQPKLHPMPREAEDGVEAGTGLEVHEVAGTTVGMVVCADILYPEVPRILSLKGAELLLVPVMSPYRGDEDEDVTRSARESLFVARAYDASAYILKAGGFTDGERFVAGRSLITAPWGIVARYGDAWSQETLRARLDLEPIREHREDAVALHHRAPGAYGDLLDPELGTDGTDTP